MERRPYRYYSTEFKLTVVQAYLNGEGGLKAIARQFGIHHPLLIKWVRKFELGELIVRPCGRILNLRGTRGARGVRPPAQHCL